MAGVGRSSLRTTPSTTTSCRARVFEVRLHAVARGPTRGHHQLHRHGEPHREHHQPAGVALPAPIQPEGHCRGRPRRLLHDQRLATTDTQTRRGFGTLFAVAKVPWTSGARVRSYASLTEMVADRFPSTDPAYRMAAAAFAQEPRPQTVKIGQRTRAFTQVVRLIPADARRGRRRGDLLGARRRAPRSFTTDATPTTAEAATRLAAAINVLTGVDADAILATGGAERRDAAVAQRGRPRRRDRRRRDDPPRRLSFTFSASADWDATNITVTGHRPGTARRRPRPSPCPTAATPRSTARKYFPHRHRGLHPRAERRRRDLHPRRARLGHGHGGHRPGGLHVGRRWDAAQLPAHRDEPCVGERLHPATPRRIRGWRPTSTSSWCSTPTSTGSPWTQQGGGRGRRGVGGKPTAASSPTRPRTRAAASPGPPPT